MVNLNKMYDGVVNSPETYLTQNLAADATIIYVADSSVFGSLPNLAVIGTDQNAETILIKSKRSDGGLEVQRALEGPAKRWEKTTAIARNFTNYDHKILKENIKLLNSDKVDKVTGKDLSSNDYTNAEKQKLAGISTGANKYVHPSTHSADMITETSTKKFVSDSEKSTWNSKLSSVSGQDISRAKTKGYNTSSTWQSLSTNRDLEDWIGDFDKRTRENKDNLNKKVDAVSGKGLSSNDFTDSAKQKVDAIPSNPKYTDTTYSNATTSSAGLMSAADKVKLNGLGGSSDLKVEVTNGDGLTFYRYGKIVVMHIFFKITQSLTSFPSNKKSIPANLKPNKDLWGTSGIFEAPTNYKTTTLTQIDAYNREFSIQSKFSTGYVGMYCIGTMVYTID